MTNDENENLVEKKFLSSKYNASNTIFKENLKNKMAKSSISFYKH